MLIQHMSQGHSFESFGAIIDSSKRVLYTWLETFPEFLQAREIGEQKSLHVMEAVGRAMYLGQLTRVKSRKPVIGADGKPIADPNRPGQWLMEEEHEQAQGNVTAWIFMMKNMHGWRNEKALVIRAAEPGKDFSSTTLTEVEQEMLELLGRYPKLPRMIIDVEPVVETK